MTQSTNPVDQRILDAERIGLINEVAEGLGATVEHSAKGGVIHTKIVLTSDTVIISGAAAAASKGGGTKLMDFPAGKLVPVASRVSGRLELSDAAMTTTAGEVGLGTVVATGAVAVLGGTATFEDILEGGGPALGNITAGSVLSFAVYDDGRALVPASGVSGSLYLNAATAFATGTTTNLLAKAGTEIEVYWIHLDT